MSLYVTSNYKRGFRYVFYILKKSIKVYMFTNIQQIHTKSNMLSAAISQHG